MNSSIFGYEMVKLNKVQLRLGEIAGMPRRNLDDLGNFELTQRVKNNRAVLSEQTGATAILRSLALLSFGLTIVLAPFRSRLILQARPHPPVYGDYTDFILFASDITLLVTLGLWLASLVLKPRRLSYGPFFLSLPIAGFTLIGLFSSIFSIDIPLSLYHSIRLLFLLGLYLYVINEISNIEKLILPISLMVIIQAVIGIEQVLQQSSVGLQFLGELELNPAWKGISIVSAQGIRSLRAYGLSDHPNILGGFLAFGLILIATWYVSSATKWRPIVAVLFSLSALGLFLTFSRSAWLALLAGISFIAILLWRLKQQAFLYNGITLVATSLILLVPFVWQNLEYLGVRLNWGDSFQNIPQENQSIGERVLLNKSANEIFADHALIGVGLGTFPLALQAKYPQFPVDYQPPHVVLLDVAAEIGIFGALFYAIAMTTPWLALWWNRKRLVFSPALIGGSALLLAVSVVGFFDYYTWLLVPGRFWYWFAWGLWALVYRSSKGIQYE